jgi:hypothetical protein
MKLGRFLRDLKRVGDWGYPQGRKSVSIAASVMAARNMAKGCSTDLRKRAVQLMEDGESRRESAKAPRPTPASINP